MAEKQLELAPDIIFGGDSKKLKRERLNQLRGLVHHPGWVYTRAVLQSQAEQAYSAIGKTLPVSIQSIMEQAELRGEANAHLLLASLPDYLIHMFEVDLGIEGNEEEDEDGI